MQKPSKDNSGDKIYVKQANGEPLLDEHGHLIVEHDLFNHEGLTQDGIAEAFIEFAKKEQLSFFELSPFDEVKYHALLEGLEVSIINFKEIDLGNRYDAEYFLKSDLNIYNLLINKESIRFRNYGYFVASAFYPAATQLYEIGDTPFIRCVDCISNPLITNLQNDNFERIPLEFAKEQSGMSLLSRGDMVITKVGSPCYASIVEEHDIVALSRTVLGIKNIKNINRYYLLIFLRAKYGFNQLLRQRELTIQYQLTLERVKNILIFAPSLEFQNKIEFLVKLAHSKLEESKTTYTAAENLLLETLGLKDFQPSQQNVNIKSFKESFLTSGRLDAEYYQPKYDELSDIISNCKYGFRKLGEIIESIKNGFDFRTFTEVGKPYIRVGDIKNGRIDKESAEKIPFELPIKKDISLQVGDVLFTRKGSFGNSSVVTKGDTDCVISSEIMLLRIKKSYIESISPYYLSIYLNSKIGFMQVEKFVHGVAFFSISQEDLANIHIITLPIKTQTQIADKIQTAFSLRQQSEKLLEIAKRAVEIAIEENEKTASSFLKNDINMEKM